MMITSLDLVDLKDLIKESIKEVLSEMLINNTNKQKPSNQNQIFSRKDTANLLKISLPTLHSYTSRGLIKSCKIGRSIRYRQEDINDALKLVNQKRIS